MSKWLTYVQESVKETVYGHEITFKETRSLANFWPYLKKTLIDDVKVTSFGRAAFSYSAVQQPFNILTPGHWATLGN